MAAYYNEFDPFAAAWLRELIKAGHIAPGDVDERSILEVKADDLKGYNQCHFFAGIGGWSYALRLALWGDDRPVWTGSAPCQPFSTSGEQKGKADARHLFPVWLGLIRECHPAIIFGEQVASAIAHGWLDDVYQGLESEGYAVGSAILPACSVGAPHRRDRLWFVADATRKRGKGRQVFHRENRGDCLETGGKIMANSIDRLDKPSSTWSDERPIQSGAWESYEWLETGDGGKLKIKPSISLLADGVPGRVGRLRAYGNAIVPQVAMQFIIASQGANT